jgi:hypothetical protein
VIEDCVHARSILGAISSRWRWLDEKKTSDEIRITKITTESREQAHHKEGQVVGRPTERLQRYMRLMLAM